MKTKIKSIEILKVRVAVQQRDIDNAKCNLISLCMHKVAIERALRNLDPKGGDHRTRVDAALIKFNLRGHHWQAILPRPAKIKLLQFDRERKARHKAERQGIKFVSKVLPHKYVIEAQKMGAIQPLTRERQEQINLARRRRIASGKPDKAKYDIRHRIEGLGTV